MYNFRNDYSEGAHEKVLEALVRTNREQTAGYGLDPYCEAAAALIRSEIKNPRAAVHFLVSGTQTNLLAISSLLKPYEAVISVDSGHIQVHETGAIENTGHKVITVAGKDGKLYPEQIDQVLREHTDEHMVKPKMVYISNSTELGTIYYCQELTALSAFCREHHLFLYLDGARLGSALCAQDNDLTMAAVAELVDCFSIGGTKNGILFGEALVFGKPEQQREFRYHMKQKGAMLAKGRLLGLQFGTLFTDRLYYNIAKHANQMAFKLAAGLKELGYPMLSESTTNQVFPVFENAAVESLRENCAFEVWGPVDEEHTCIRFVTSWATTEETVDEFLKFLDEAGVNGDEKYL